mgnify:CR=1 FL=1
METCHGKLTVNLATISVSRDSFSNIISKLNRYNSLEICDLWSEINTSTMPFVFGFWIPQKTVKKSGYWLFTKARQPVKFRGSEGDEWSCSFIITFKLVLMTFEAVCILPRMDLPWFWRCYQPRRGLPSPIVVPAPLCRVDKSAKADCGIFRGLGEWWILIPAMGGLIISSNPQLIISITQNIQTIIFMKNCHWSL